MKLVTNKKNKKRYLLLFKLLNASNAHDGQIMCLYIGPSREKFGLGIFVREISEFEDKFY